MVKTIAKCAKKRLNKRPLLELPDPKMVPSPKENRLGTPAYIGKSRDTIELL